MLPFPRKQTENYSCLKSITLSYANIRSKRKKKNNLSFASLTFQKNNVSITFSMILKILQILLTLFVSLTRYKKSIHCVSIETNKEDHIPPNFFVELGLTKVLKECRFDQEMEPCHIKTLPIKRAEDG